MIKNGSSFMNPAANAPSPIIRTRPNSAKGSISNGVNSPVVAHQAPPKPQDPIEISSRQRTDIESISMTMNELKRELATLKSAVEEIKADRSSSAARNAKNGPSFPKEFEALTDNVSRLNSRVGDLDGLRLEMLVTKRRVKNLEEISAPSTQSSHTVTGYTPQSTQGFPNPTANHEGMTDLVSSRSIPQVTAGRKEVPNSASTTPQAEDVPAPFPGNVKPLAEAKRLGLSPGVYDLPMAKPIERDLYGVTPEYRARQGPELPNDSNHRPLAPSVPVPQLNQPMPSSFFVPIPEPHVRSTPPVAAVNQFTTVNRPVVAARHLNDANVVQISDPEDDDYAPDSQRPPSPRPVTRGPRRGEKVRLPTPDWEKPGWVGPKEATRPDLHTSPRDKRSPRRNINNQTGGPSPKRRKTTVFEFENGLPASWTESSAHSTQQPSSTFTPSQTEQLPWVPPQKLNGIFQPSPYPENPHQLEPPTRLESENSKSRESVKGKDGPKEKQDLRSVPRTRDDRGRLLRPDGRVDGRSVRYGTPNPKRRASAGGVVNKSAATTPVVATVNSPAPAPIVVDTPPPVIAAVNSPAARNSPAAVNSPMAVDSPVAVDSPATTTPAAVNSPAPPAVQSPAEQSPAAAPSPPAPPTPAAASTPPVTTSSTTVTTPAAVPSPAAAAPGPPWSAAGAPAAPATRKASLRETRKLRRSGAGKDRDEEGNLLSRSGKVDGRSLRYKRAKEKMEAEREREGSGEGDGEGEGEEEEGDGGDGGDMEDGDGRGQLVGD